MGETLIYIDMRETLILYVNFIGLNYTYNLYFKDSIRVYYNEWFFNLFDYLLLNSPTNLLFYIYFMLKVSSTQYEEGVMNILQLLQIYSNKLGKRCTHYIS